MRARLIAALLVVAALVGGNLPGNAAIWSPPEIYNAPNNIVGVNIVDSFFNTGEQVSRLEAMGEPMIRPDGTPNSRLCTSPGVAPCNQSNQTLQGTLLLPACQTAAEAWCIESVGIRKKSDAEGKSAKFIRQVDSQIVPDLPGDGIPGGSSMSLWSAEGFKNSGGVETYAAYVVVKGTKSLGRPFTFTEFTAMLIPYSEKRGTNDFGMPFERAFAEEITLPDGSIRVTTRGVANGCAWTETGVCGLIEDFPADVRATMTLRMSNQLTGWLMGRMTEPTIDVTPINTEINKLVVDAEPVNVPKFYVTVERSKVTPAIAQMLPPNADFSGIYNTQPNNSKAFLEIEAWKDAAQDKAAGLVTTWSVTTVSFGFDPMGCLSDRTKLLGVVTTNAMVYEGTAPAFENGSLNYKVGGMHLNPDGSVFQGTYDLVMRKATAQCLYGFTDAPITATVTVVDAGKEERIETSSLQELGSGANKWLKLSARGFTFSSPTLKIKLNQAKPAAPTAPATEQKAAAPAAPVVKAPAKTSITCVKGKLTRKVLGVAPKCPAGFKKK